ncbi:hypothetical protein LDENG_00172230 [Lucifuga dentata]|nr:hypothetical protein LDENG_00172230 [Lucifuga dentata]
MMEGSDPGGNPSAASSQSLPVHAEEQTKEGADWLSAVAASEEEDHQQTREESTPRPHRSQTGESLTERDWAPEESHQSADTNQINHQDPPNPGDSVSTNQQNQKDSSPPNFEDLSPKGQQNPEDSTDQQNPPNFSTDQQSREDSLSSNPEDSPSTDQQNSENSPSANQPNLDEPLLKHQLNPGVCSAGKLNLNVPPLADGFSFALVSTSDKHQTHKDLSPPPIEDSPAFTSDTHQEQNQKDRSPAHSDPKDQHNHQNPPSAENLITSTSMKNQNSQHSPRTDQETQQDRLSADWELQQVSPHPADQLIQKKPPSTEYQNVNNPLSTDSKTQQVPPTTDLKPNSLPANKDHKPQQSVSSTDLKLTQTPPATDQKTQQVPPPTTNLNIQQVPSNRNQKPQQPSETTVQKPPQVPAGQQNHPSSQTSQLNLSPTKPSTLAPPLTIEAFCDQVQPHPLAFSTLPSAAEPKLCGYLQKQGGPLKAWKQRWFTYEEKKNQLFYYRTPQDVMPLGQVELDSATFTYPLKAEKGTFHIQTPERTFILKAVNQDLMLYWLQQLQVKRWQHRRQQSAGCSSCSDPTNNNNNTAEDFLPLLKSPVGLVGEEAASTQTQRTPLTNMSIKHPLIEIQNSVHSLRKRSSQECSQSVFHIDASLWTQPSPANTTNTTSSVTPVDSPTSLTSLPSPDPAGKVSPVDGRQSSSLFDSQRNKRTKSRNSSTAPSLRRDTLSSSFSDRMSRLQHEKQMLVEEVKAQKELVWLLHKALEGAQLEKRTCVDFVAAKGEQERLELLRHRERQAADLQGRLEEAKAEVEVLRRSLEQRDTHVAEMQENIRMLMEKNEAKKEVILKLSDQISASMLGLRHSITPSNSLDTQNFQKLQQQIENLKDDIEAYKTQNKFLNSELYQLTTLWRNSSEQEKSLMVKCAYLEASNCQVESRYLGVLQKLQETKVLDPVQRDAVGKLIEDALRGELKSVIKLQPIRDHDEYGFKIVPDYEVEDMKLLAKIQALEIRSHNLLHQEGGEHPLLTRWAQYLAGRSENDLCPSPELKGLLRGGVPLEYRQRVWRWVVLARTKTIRERHPQRYQQLCEKSRTSPHSASRQIQLDLHRTLTTNQHFSSPCSPTLQQLQRILLAFSWQNPAIGYCQGLNRLAAIALLVLQSEEDAFWCLVAVVETIMPQDYYTKNLVASQADQRVLKDFMAEKLPRLAAHFEEHNIDVSLVTFNWFMVVFVESLPSDILLRLWDAFLYEGTKVIFRYTLALFKYKEDDILKIRDNVEIYQYFRFFTKTISDGRKLASIAFSDMNPFPGRLLRNRRAFHLERLQGELKELEEQQKEFVTESAERKDKELDNVSEDDEEL